MAHTHTHTVPRTSCASAAAAAAVATSVCLPMIGLPLLEACLCGAQVWAHYPAAGDRQVVSKAGTDERVPTLQLRAQCD
jgi:hypothetical protein